jgi:hypothetical protein
MTIWKESKSLWLIEIIILLSFLPERAEVPRSVLSPPAVAAAEVLHEVNVWERARERAFGIWFLGFVW